MGSGNLSAWIDWNNDGDFDDSGEQIANAVAGSTETLTVAFTVPLGVVSGNTYARFRFSSDAAAANPTGTASNGEVEDYQITINNDPTPPSAPSLAHCTTTWAANGSGGYQSTTAQGLVVTATASAGANSSWSFAPNDALNASGTFSAATLNGSASLSTVFFWDTSPEHGRNDLAATDGETGTLSFNFSVPVNDPLLHIDRMGGTGGESTASPQQLSNTSVMTPNAANASATFTRLAGTTHFVVTAGSIQRTPNETMVYGEGGSESGTDTTRDTAMGSVEVPGNYSSLALDFAGAGVEGAGADGLEFVLCAHINDYSDAPADGSTAPGGVGTTAYGETTHVVSGSMLLGASNDVESGSIADTNAAGDGAEDDGVTIPALEQGGSITIPVTVAQASANQGYLQGWIDWNGDGDFDDEVAGLSEQIATDLQLTSGATGAINIPVNIPINAFTGQTFARFRWSSTAGLDAITAANDGEVEDYAVTINARPEPVVQTCPVTPLFTGSVYDTTGISTAGGTLTQDITGVPALPVTLSAMTGPTAGGFNFIGNAAGKLHYNHDPSVKDGVLLNSYNFVRQTPIHLRAGPVNGVSDSAMNNLVETLTIVARGASAGFTWVINTIQDGTAVVSADGLSVTIKASTTAAHTQFDIASNGELMQMDVSRHSSVVTTDNTIFYMDAVTCNDITDAPVGGTASHVLLSGIYLGPDVDIDTNLLTPADADGDGRDDDGVRLNGTTLQDQTLSNDRPSTLTVTTTGSGQLHGWIDWDGDGVFGNNVNELIVSETTTASGTRTIVVTPPNGLTSGTSYARFRYSSDAVAASPTGTANDGEVEDYRIMLSRGFTISGRIFNDTNVNASSDAAEPGIAGVAVVLYDTVNLTCTSTSTNANGDYAFTDVAPGDYQVYEAAGESVPVPQNCNPANAADPAGYLSTVANSSATFTVSNSDLSGINFGDIQPPLFELDNEQTILPNSAALHPHVFTAQTDGSVSFSVVAESVDPATLNWGLQLLLDANCDGQLSSANGDSAMPANINVTAGQQVCILAKVVSPSNASAGAVHVIDIQSDFTYGDGTLGIANDLQTHRDITRSLAGTTTAPPVTPAVDPVGTPDPIAGEGKLSLVKSVWNVTRNIDGNVALPGETLRYIIHYENIGNGPLNELIINDSVPAFTQLVPASMLCTDTPTELPACAANDSNGGLSWGWTVNDNLLPGSSGSVSYEVVVE